MSTNNKVAIHTKALNLARRWSVQNENDLMQEDMYDNTMDSPTSRKLTRDYCKDLAGHLMHLRSLPAECLQFEDVASDLKRRDSDTTHPTQILS